MALHIGYETVEPWPLKRTDMKDEKRPARASRPRHAQGRQGSRNHHSRQRDAAFRRARAAWDYRLGNRSGLEWILDQYKEKKPKDPTIREKFDTYRFADYKEKVIDLLARVARVSVETMEIVSAMKAAES